MRTQFILVLLIALSFSAIAQSNIGTVEYYIDSDPGVGNGTPAVFTAGTKIDETIQVPTTGLEEGYHVVVFRVQNVNQQWSIEEIRPFFVHSVDANAIEPITRIEYYIDDDPGFGLGTSLNNLISNQTVDFIDNIPTATLTEGIHQLVIRAQDSDGKWSLKDVRPFMVTESDAVVVEDLVAAEYYIDQDPGTGSATPLPNLITGPTADWLENIPTGQLNDGIHKLVVRVQDAKGKWSLVDQRAFVVKNRDVNTPSPIIALEYFFDNDPGIGNGFKIDFTDTVALNLDSILLTQNLEIGFHKMQLRALAADSLWSMVDSKVFYVTAPNKGTITQIEYFINDDPGHGNGIMITIPDTSYVDTLLSIITDTLPKGNYTIGFRAASTDTVWGITEYSSFEIDFLDSCDIDSLALVDMYQTLNHTNWSDTTGWLTAPVSQWAGIGLNGCRVDTIDLSGFGLEGVLPSSLKNLWAARYIDLSNNSLFDSIPSIFNADTNLVFLDLDSNNFSSLASFDSLKKLNTLSVAGNNLRFEDLIPNVALGIPNYIYAPQQPLGVDSSYVYNEGDTLSYSFAISGDGNQYQWLLNDDTLQGATNDTLFIAGIAGTDSGTYQLLISNPSLPGLTITSGLQTTKVIIKVSSVDITFLGNNEFCPGDSIELNAPLSNAYQWYVNGDSIVGANSQSYYVQDSGSYSLKIIQGGDTLVSEDTIVYPRTMTKPQAGPDSTMESFTVLLSGNSPNFSVGETGAWSSNSAGGSFSNANSAATIFTNTDSTSMAYLTWTITDSSGACSLSDSSLYNFPVSIELLDSVVAVFPNQDSVIIDVANIILEGIVDITSIDLPNALNAKVMEGLVIYYPTDSAVGIIDTIEIFACNTSGVCGTALYTINMQNVSPMVDTSSYSIADSSDNVIIEISNVITDANGDQLRVISLDSTFTFRTELDAFVEIDTVNNTITIDYETFVVNNNTDYITLLVCEGNEPLANCDTAVFRVAIEIPENKPEIVVHNVISNNGDILNNYLYLEHAEQHENVQVKIIGRQGGVVFKTNNYENNGGPNQCFYGNSNIGTVEKLGTGIYYYTVDYPDFKRLKGFILLNNGEGY